MKKSKFNGEKLLLILGGVGIVAIIAVITFLISFSIGGKDVEKEESKATTSQTFLYDGAQSGAEDSHKVDNSVTEGITEVPDAEIDLSCRDAINIFTDCFIYGKTDDAEKMLPMSVWEDLADGTGTDAKGFIDVVKTGLSGNGISSKLNAGATVTCDVNSVLVIRDTAEEEIKSAVSQKHNIDKSAITDVYAVSMVVEYNAGGEVTSTTDELYCVRIDGVWYLAEKDCLAVYYMLSKELY